MNQSTKAPLRAILRGLLAVLLASLLPVAVTAQNKRTVTGTVVDELGEPLPGVTVMVSGATSGTATDIDGHYSLRVPDGATQLEFSYIGYNKVLKAIAGDRCDVAMTPNSQVMDEVVVIGYGTQKKEDLTGSITAISEKDFNKGVISSAEELINGKVAGLQIVNSGGSPNGGTTIRVRGGASLNASNDPLIVLDGVPMEVGGGVEGAGNFLSLINPNDIESMTILKDASSTAIYGSRASNGVIIITTKKGKGDRIGVSFSTTNSVSHAYKFAPMLSTAQFRDAVNTFGTDAQKAVMGDADTDWNDATYRDAFGTDNSLSVSGRAAAWLPFRVSLGGTYQEGVLRNDWNNRYTANVNLSPSFLDDHLKVNLSGKGTYSRSRTGNAGAVWNAAAYDPTQPIHRDYGDAEYDYGGYYEVIDNVGGPAQGGIANPVAMTELNSNRSKVWRFVGNADVDYTLHWLPELRLHVTGGYDYSHGKRTVDQWKNSFSGYNSGGYHYTQGPQNNYNRLLTAYANYNKTFAQLKSTVDATIGYDYQYWRNDYPAYATVNDAGEQTNVTSPYDSRHTLLSYYGRVNYSFDSRYLLTATFRRDGSSRFSKDERWGTFPSVALAWRVSNEKFWQGLRDVVNDFKLRASYGITGQQDGIADYGYIPSYTISQEGASYLFNGQWINTYRPEAYNDKLKWETTKSWNYGIDLGLLNNRIVATVDYYTRKTEDLLATVPVPAGINFDKSMLMNVGNVESKGVELTLSATIVDNRDWTWSAAFNATYIDTEITNLNLVPGTDDSDTYIGYMESTPIQVYKSGYTPRTFKLYKQIYDEATGRPIEGLYADLDGNGTIDENDKYYCHSASPDWLLGFSTSLRYKRWTLSTSLRASLGNYVYNGMAANMGAWECTTWCAGQINNLSESFADSQFRYRQYPTDYYLENASFLKMDNLQLSYDFGRVYRGVSLNLSAMVQNVFTITNYSGIDPECQSGIDNSSYPRPRTFSLTLGLNF